MPVADDYLVFLDGVRDLCAIDLRQYRRGQMERRIRSFARRRGASGLAEYLRVLRAERAELDEFLDRLTINVSQLWRNPEQWELIGRSILPEIVNRTHPPRPVSAWSAGCSYGAEAYTLAALLREHVPGGGRVRYTVRGTDIDRRVVDRAREGWFTAEDARSAPPAMLERHFERRADGFRARPELKVVCRFEVGDLLQMRIRTATLDLILCRNTVIYFTDEVRDALHGRLAGALRPGGYLVIGSTERVHGPRALGLVPTHPFVYRKSA